MLPQFLLTTLLTAMMVVSAAQEPHYTPKQFKSVYDSSLFEVMLHKGNGPMRSYLITNPELFDVDDNNTTPIKTGGTPTLICIEGHYKEGKRSGLFTFFVFDSTYPTKRYKIWEQQYANDQLNGTWNVYNLKGKLVSTKHFTNDSLNGISRDYWIDGRSIIEEREYFNGQQKYILRTFFQHDNIIESEITIVNGAMNGTGKRYYNNGTIQEEAQFKNNVFHGVRKYYHPNGKIWIAEEYKDGKPWTVLANYNSQGHKREAGTLKNGNGTVIFYNEDNSIRETNTFKNGEMIKE